MPPSMICHGRNASSDFLVAVEVGVGVEAGLGDRGAPVAAVALGDFDDVRHTAVAQRQQALVVRMPLGLDVEVHVVDVRHQLAAGD
jgi:hypothetical protein